MRTYRLFAVFGSSGSGKSKLLEIIRQICPEASVHRKFTTRGLRPGENPANMEDLEIVQTLDPSLCVEIYEKYGSFYGIKRELIQKAHAEGEMHFIIIRDIQAIRRLKALYPELVVIYVHADPHRIKKDVQKREGVQRRERLRRLHEDFVDYVHNPTLFDHVVINFWDIDNAIRQLRHIIAHYNHAAAQSLVV